jgi:DNA primase
MLIADWDSIAPWLSAELFDDDANRAAFETLVGAGGDALVAIESADDEARAVLESAAVADVEGDPLIEARNLIAAATRRELRRVSVGAGADRISADATARLTLEDLGEGGRADEAAAWLLGWLIDRREGDGGSN